MTGGARVATKRVITRDPKTGEEYGVTVATHEKLYAPRGFKIVSFEDGQAWEPPEKPKAASTPAGKE